MKKLNRWHSLTLQRKDKAKFKKQIKNSNLPETKNHFVKFLQPKKKSKLKSEGFFFFLQNMIETTIHIKMYGMWPSLRSEKRNERLKCFHIWTRNNETKWRKQSKQRAKKRTKWTQGEQEGINKDKIKIKKLENREKHWIYKHIPEHALWQAREVNMYIERSTYKHIDMVFSQPLFFFNYKIARSKLRNNLKIYRKNPTTSY